MTRPNQGLLMGRTCYLLSCFFFFRYLTCLHAVSSKSFSKSFLAQSRIMTVNTFWKTVSLLHRWHMMTTVVKISYSLDILNLVKNSFCLHFSIFLLCKPLLVNFFWLLSFTFQIRNNLTNIFKTVHHVEQNKENSFLLTSYMYLRVL